MNTVAWPLVAAAGINAVLAAYWMAWKPDHHSALASMMGWERRGRPPLIPWRRLIKRFKVIRTAAGAGAFALREVVSAAIWALAATALSFALTIATLSYAQMRQGAAISIEGKPAATALDVGLALLSHTASVKLNDGFAFTGLPQADFRGDLWLTVLLLTFFAVVASAALKAMGEWLRCLWYAMICIAMPNAARRALSGQGGGLVWRALGKPGR